MFSLDFCDGIIFYTILVHLEFSDLEESIVATLGKT